MRAGHNRNYVPAAVSEKPIVRFCEMALQYLRKDPENELQGG